MFGRGWIVCCSGMLLDCDGQGAGISGGGNGDEAGGHAWNRSRDEGQSAIEGGGCRRSLGGEERAVGATAMRRAGRRPGVERLVESDGSPGHGVAIHVADAQGDEAWGTGGGKRLGGG